MIYSWHDEKNQWLQTNRGISFERIVVELEQAEVRVLKHPNSIDYPNQCLYVLEIDAYTWVVPHEISGDTIRLITAFPSRKMKKEIQR